MLERESLSFLGLQSRAMTSFFRKFHPFSGESGITFYALSNEPIKKGGKIFTQKSLLKIVHNCLVKYLHLNNQNSFLGLSFC